MQTTSTAFTTAMNQGLSLQALPRVIAEWNHNRYASSVAVNNLAGLVENESYPITSIIEPLRPTSGILKARVGEAKIGQSRVVSPLALYKYWNSSTQSDGSGNITGVQPTVIYGESRQTNKIVIGFETTWTTPTAYTVYVTTDGSSWTPVATTPALNADKQIILYRQSGGTWTTAVTRDYPTAIRGIRVDVTAINKGGSHVSIIEMSARLESDISGDVMTVGIDKDLEEPDIIFPVGTPNANSGTITLDNTTKTYDNDNATSPYYGMIDANVQFTVSYGINTTPHGGAGFEYVQQGVFYSDDKWNVDSDAATVSIPLKDYSKFLQNKNVDNVLYQNMTTSKIILALLKTAGFNRFVTKLAPNEVEYVFPFIYFSDETSVWDAISQVVKSDRGVVYFDEFNNLVYVSKEYIKSKTTVDLPLLAVKPDASTQPNLISLEGSHTVQASRVKVSYRPRHLNMKDDRPINDALWRPDGTVALQSAELVKANFMIGDWKFYISEADAKTWPWKGMANVEGEIVAWDGKVYKYWEGGVAKYATVKTFDEEQEIYKRSDIARRHMNVYTGEIQNVTRGLLGSTPADHTLGASPGWNSVRKYKGQAAVAYPQGTSVTNSAMRLNSLYTAPWDGWYIAEKGATSDVFHAYGTKIMFADAPYKHGAAGMVLHLQGDHSQGYYFELTLTEVAVKQFGGNIANVRCYKIMPDGSGRALPNTAFGQRGLDYNIVKGQWVQMDVTYNSSTKRFTLYINGVTITSWVDPYGGQLNSGRWGPYVRGNTIAFFEYFYALNTTEGDVDVESSTFQDRINGGYTSGFASKSAWKYKGKTQWFFDEFGPIFQEIREFNVEFEKFPAVTSFPHLANEASADILEYRSTPYNARFLIGNVKRQTSVLNGDDTSSIPNQTLNAVLLVYGNLVIEDEETSDTYDNEAAIRRHGVVELEYSADWIQTEAQAKAVGEFINTRFGEPMEVLEAEIYANPALQIGDIVSVNFPERYMLPATHKYQVTSISIGFDSGLTERLTLQRVMI